MTFDAESFCDVSTGCPDLGVRLVVDMTPEQAVWLRDELNRQLVALPARQISLHEARGILDAKRGQVAKLWSAMVRSSVFHTKCSECEPNRAYCPHYASATFDTNDVITHMDAFATAVEQRSVRNAGSATVTLGFRLAEALKSASG